VVGVSLLAGCSSDDAARWSGRQAEVPRAREPLHTGPLVAPSGDCRLVVKFADEVRARVDPDGRPVARGLRDISRVRLLLDERGVRARPWLGTDAAAAVAERAQRRSGRAQPDFAGIVALEGDRAQLQEVAWQLASDPTVEVVWFERLRPRPPLDIDPPSDSFVEGQGYLYPEAMNVVGAWDAGFDGGGVRLTDVEYGWQVTHEEFNEIDTHPEPGQTTHPDAVTEGFVDHGTAVIGLLVADASGYGVSGLAPSAELYTYPEWTVEEGPRRATALANAFADSESGDIVLVEMQQEENLSGAYGPAELEPGIWMLTRAATDAGIVVVAAGGNGGIDLDSPELAYYRERGDSGAILVGAGVPDTREPLSYSTYGDRINVQGWGQGVFTTAYGDLALFGDDPDQAYTGQFAGTSSASALVAGAVTLVQQAAWLTGQPLTPEQMRQVLLGTGKPQAPGNHVGPLPDVGAATLVAMSPEEEPPFVVIDTPGPTATVEPVFETDVLVDAFDDSGHVARVRLLVNGEEQPIVDEVEPFQFSGVVFPAGEWELVAIAEDAWGNEGLSEPVLLEVGIEPPPDTTGGPPETTGDIPPPPEGTTTTPEPTGGPEGSDPMANGDSGCGCTNRSGEHPFSGGRMIVLALLTVTAARRRRRSDRGTV
jgi:hypothetical protein